MTTEKTIAEFISEHGITMRVKPHDSNPYMDDSVDMDHWLCLLKGPHGRMQLHFSMGSAHGGLPPDAPMVLDCLASDSSSVEEQDFDEWCGDFGYDTDSRRAKRIYDRCRKQAAVLERILGGEAFEQLLYHTERL